MQFELHIAPEGHIYASSLGDGADSVHVYRAAVLTNGVRAPGNLNIRPSRANFERDEATNWPRWGYVHCGPVSLPFETPGDKAGIKQAFDALVAQFDQSRSTGKRLAVDPGTRNTFYIAACFLCSPTLTSVLTEPAGPSRYQWG